MFHRSSGAFCVDGSIFVGLGIMAPIATFTLMVETVLLFHAAMGLALLLNICKYKINGDHSNGRMFQETQTNISFPDERELSFYSYIHDISFTPYNIHVSSTLPPKTQGIKTS